MKNTLIGVVVVATVLGALVYFGMSPFGKTIVRNEFGNSPAGTTFNTAKIAAVTVSLVTSTSTSILNNDAFDRFVTGINLGCETMGKSYTAVSGGGLASLLWSVGTTTTANPAAFLSYAAIASGIAIGTTSQNFLLASSTVTSATATSSMAAIWPTGTYMTFYWNATNTSAVCTEGVSYFGS